MKHLVWSVAFWPVMGTSARGRQAVYMVVVQAGDRLVREAKLFSDKLG
jgi:hypothetical protein